MLGNSFLLFFGNYYINLFEWYFLWLLSIEGARSKMLEEWMTLTVCARVDWLNIKLFEMWMYFPFLPFLFRTHSDRFLAFNDKSHPCRLHEKQIKKEKKRESNWIETKRNAMSMLLSSSTSANITILSHRNFIKHSMTYKQPY